jgi:hypothetical protein
MRWRIGVLAGLALTGCSGPEPAGETAAEPATSAEHIIDLATGETRMAIPHEDGVATLRSGPNVPLTLPDGLSLFPGSRVLDNSLVTRPRGKGTLVTFEADAPAAAVIAHYRDQAQAAGFVIALDVEAGGTLMVGGARDPDGATLSVTATTGKPTAGQLVISSGASD